MLVHVNEASKTFSRVLLNRVDTDVVIIAIPCFKAILHLNKNFKELQIEFGVRKTLQYISIQKIAENLRKCM